MNDNIKVGVCSFLPHYKEILSKFDFARPFVDDPEIFNFNSAASRNFLIQAFAYIHPNFHFLSFLNKEIDQEIIKAAAILQILPTNTKKSDKFFDNLSDSEIKKFWSRLFALLNNKNGDGFRFDTIRTSQEKKFGFLKDINKTLDYVLYELPVVKEKSFSDEFLNKEIKEWNNVEIKCSHTQNDLSVLNYDTHQAKHINSEKLLMDMKQVTSVLQNIQFINNVNRLEHLEFFNNFTSLTQNIDQYIKNLEEINSSFLDELHYKMVSEGKPFHSSSLFFLKRCNNFLKTLEYNNKFS